MTGASFLMIVAACLTGCLVEGDREYDPPALPQLFSGTRLSRVLADYPRLWLVLKKRLGAGGDRRCSADQRRNNTIIKTKDSLDAGAQFITAPSVTNYRDCEDECCREKTCNTAVVNLKESKVPVSFRGRLVFAFARLVFEDLLSRQISVAFAALAERACWFHSTNASFDFYLVVSFSFL